LGEDGVLSDNRPARPPHRNSTRVLPPPTPVMIARSRQSARRASAAGREVRVADGDRGAAPGSAGRRGSMLSSSQSGTTRALHCAGRFRSRGLGAVEVAGQFGRQGQSARRRAEMS
jgi:hypothetical protein